MGSDDVESPLTPALFFAGIDFGIGHEGDCGDDPAPNPTPPKWSDYYQARDHLGTLRLVTDISGYVQEAHDYEPFGLELVPPGESPGTLRTRKFTGHERDASTGLDYMMARYYPASMARFLSVDPGSDAKNETPQSWNLYGYVRNNPGRLTDPTGRVVMLDDDQKKRNAQMSLIRESLGKEGGKVTAVQQGDGHWVLGTEKGVSLNQLSKGGVAAHGMAHLIAAVGTFHLEVGSSAKATAGQGAAWVGDGQGGGTFYVDPSAFPKQTGDVKQTAASAFVHEMGHGLSEVFKGIKFRGGELVGLFAGRESNAMTFENAFRREQHLDVRTKYSPIGNIFILDSSVPPVEVIP